MLFRSDALMRAQVDDPYVGAQVDDPYVEAQVDEPYVGAQVESYVGMPIDILEVSMAKKGGRKGVDPHKLKEHAESSRRLNEGNMGDKEKLVGLTSSFEPLVRFLRVSNLLLLRVTCTKTNPLPTLGEVSLQCMAKCESEVYHRMILVWHKY